MYTSQNTMYCWGEPELKTVNKNTWGKKVQDQSEAALQAGSY